LTRIPVGGFPYSRDDWRWSTAHFPLVGAVLGVLLALLHRALWGAGPLAASAITVAVGMLLTGAFHEDGLADTADALGGAFDREKLFLILKDSRVGSFGSGALTIVLLIRVVLLGRLEVEAPLALVLTQCTARTPPIWLMGAMDYVTADEAAKSRQVVRARTAQVAVATLYPTLLLGGLVGLDLLTPTRAVAVGGTAAAVALVCGWRFWLRAGGITGDFLGATEQVGECAMLLAMCLA
jgi:adenosylcobinamide-GDP ribazoletransferase